MESEEEPMSEPMSQIVAGLLGLISHALDHDEKVLLIISARSEDYVIRQQVRLSFDDPKLPANAADEIVAAYALLEAAGLRTDVAICFSPKGSSHDLAAPHARACARLWRHRLHHVLQRVLRIRAGGRP